MSRIVTDELRDGVVSFYTMNVAFLNYSLGMLHPSVYFLSEKDYAAFYAISKEYFAEHPMVKAEIEWRGHLMMNGIPVTEDKDLQPGTIGLLISDELSRELIKEGEPE